MNPKKSYQPLRQRLGFTLLELVLVLGGIAALGAGSFVAYKTFNGRAQTNTAIEATRYLANSLMQTYGQTGSFANLDTQSVINGQLAPSDLPAKGNALSSPWGGTVTVAPATAGPNAYSITFNTVPSGACTNMASRLSKDFASVQVNGTQVSSPSQALDVGNTAKVCGGGNKNTLTLTSTTVALPDPGEVDLPSDNGAPPKLPVTNPAALKIPDVLPVPAVDAQVSVLPTKLAPLPSPTQSSVSVTGAPSFVSQTSGTAALPPTTALPPQTCFASVVPKTVTTTDYGYQTLACSAGYAGSISQQQSRTASVTTTTTTTCATPWAAPSVTSSTAPTVYGTWSAWATTANSCAAMCSTQLPGYGAHYNYQWVTVNVGCPAGYNGTNSYQVLQQQVQTAYCPNPSATSAPVYGGWSGWSNTGSTQNYVNTCVPNVTPPANVQIAGAMWAVNMDVSIVPTATYYEIGASCMSDATPLPTGPFSYTIKQVPVAGLPSTATTPNGLDTFSPAYRIGGIGLGTSTPGVNQVTAMYGALPQSSCMLTVHSTDLFGNPVTYKMSLGVSVYARACNSSGCSSWTPSFPAWCSWSKC